MWRRRLRPRLRLTRTAITLESRIAATSRTGWSAYTLGYDVVNQLRTIVYSDGLTPNVSLQYDADGQRNQMVEGASTTTYTFDSLHRITQSTNGAGAQVAYAYDLLGHATRIVYPGGTNSVKRGYDDVDRLASVTDWLNNTTRLAYDQDGNPTTVAYPNRVAANLTYDAADRLGQIVDVANGSQFLNLTYSRDNGNQLASENATIYGYDPNNRLTGASTGA